MDGKTPPPLPAPLYGEATASARAWTLGYIARNREMLDLMARL